MSISFQITSDSEFTGAVIHISSGLKVISADHPAYTEIRDGLLDGSLDSEDKLWALINPAEAVSTKLTALSERVAYRHGEIFFDGDRLDNAVGAHILRIIESGEGEVAYKPLVRFLEKVATNPSEASKAHLYHFVADNGMTITEEGDLLAYKGTNSDGTSTRAGYGIVNGEIIESGLIPNEVGSVIEIPRSMVDDNRNSACSVGLHVGAYSYASSHAPRLLRVLVNPRDVVAVPYDSSNQKVRVCRYVVLAENHEEVEGTTYTFTKEDREVTQSSGWSVPEAVPYEHGTESHYDEEEYNRQEAEEKGGDAQAEAVEAIIDRDTASNGLPYEGTPEEIYFLRKVDEFKRTIPGLVKEGKALRRHRSKNVTAKARPAFDAAVRDLGLTY